MTGQNTLHLDATNFDELVLASEVPVLVDFWATWCGPCRAVAPVIDAVAQQYAGRARVGKVDVDQSRALALRYNVQSIPTLMVFVGGRAVEQVLGAAPIKKLAALLDPHVEAAAERTG